MAPPGELQVNAGVVWLAGNTMWSTPKRIRGEVLTTMRYTNRRLPLRYLYLIWLTNWTGDSALCWLHLLTAVYPTADRYVLLFAFTNFQPHVFEVFLTSLLLLQYMQVGFFYSIFTHKPTCDERKFISLKPSHKYDKSTIRLWETNATTKLQRSYAMRMKIIRNSYASITHTA